MSLGSWTLTFDVESLGLYGDAFAVGAVIHNHLGEEMGTLFEHCPHTATKEASLDLSDPRNRSEWIVKNVVPVLKTPASCKNPREIRDKFWKFYREWIMIAKNLKMKLDVVVDAGYPVETNFLRECVGDSFEERQYEGPYPLQEVQTAIKLAGYTKENERLAGEEPAHHPLADSRQSARIWRECNNMLVRDDLDGKK
ncbi:MAG: hypothetical protein Hyperionvirus5_121 [Hyperionvirus sp.]|uniref:Uncharacterized protein n=1 Tax=Hyperionvirus sp. TaxID=2487770 RepID=A0A3G5A7V8_9VIRU|nr:MAG: hypothetical protein Hyperionvirus5_121 [Hyperionvirus sp.]